MCLRAVKQFEKPVKEMIGWKVLSYEYGKYFTPFLDKSIKKNQKFLIAKGKKTCRRDPWDNHLIYKGGFIHCYRTRSAARNLQKDTQGGHVVKVKCYGVKAFGTDRDLVCDKIEFLWNEKT